MDNFEVEESTNNTKFGVKSDSKKIWEEFQRHALELLSMEQ